MNEDKVKGTIDDAAGRAKRQVGEWTGDTKAQVDGAAQQVKGKVEKAWGAVKDSSKNRDTARTDEEIDSERKYDSDRP